MRRKELEEVLCPSLSWGCPPAMSSCASSRGAATVPWTPHDGSTHSHAACPAASLAAEGKGLVCARQTLPRLSLVCSRMGGEVFPAHPGIGCEFSGTSGWDQADRVPAVCGLGGESCDLTGHYKLGDS